MKYNELDVYKLAYRLALDIHPMTESFPKHEQFGGMADQLRRSSKSICANMAEGLSKYGGSNADERRFLSIALGSVEESCVWLNFSRDLGYLAADRVDELVKDYEEVARMIFALMKRRDGVRAA
jgi:four helix bundle protein